jgi:hypothetical protein
LRKVEDGSVNAVDEEHTAPSSSASTTPRTDADPDVDDGDGGRWMRGLDCCVYIVAMTSTVLLSFACFLVGVLALTLFLYAYTFACRITE